MLFRSRRTTNPKVGGSNPSWCASRIKGLRHKPQPLSFCFLSTCGNAVQGSPDSWASSLLVPAFTPHLLHRAPPLSAGIRGAGLQAGQHEQAAARPGGWQIRPSLPSNTFNKCRTVSLGKTELRCPRGRASNRCFGQLRYSTSFLYFSVDRKSVV